MFGGSYGYRSPSRGGFKAAQRFESSKWRVVCDKPLPVSGEMDGREPICDLEPRSLCDLLHKETQTLPNGNVRALIIDPVWKGWVTLRTARGDSNLECIDGDDSIARIASHGGAAATPELPPPKPQPQEAWVTAEDTLGADPMVLVAAMGK